MAVTMAMSTLVSITCSFGRSDWPQAANVSTLAHDQLCPAGGSLHQFLRSCSHCLGMRHSLIDRLRISGEFMDGFFQSCAHLFDRVVMGQRIKHTFTLDDKQAAPRYFGQCTIRLLVVGAPLTNRQIPCQVNFPALMYFNGRRLG